MTILLSFSHQGDGNKTSNKVGKMLSWKGVLRKMEQWLWRKKAPTPLSLPANPPSHCPFLDDTADVIKIVPKSLHSSPQHLYLRFRPLGTVRRGEGNSESGRRRTMHSTATSLLPLISGVPPMDPQRSSFKKKTKLKTPWEPQGPPYHIIILQPPPPSKKTSSPST